MRQRTLVNCYVDFCHIRSSHTNESPLNLLDYNFLYPTTILPIMGYMIENSVRAIARQDVQGYLSTILPHLVANKPYIPSRTYALRKLIPGDSDLIKKTTEEVIDLADSSYGGNNAVWYLLTELGNNIDNHSNFNNAFMMAQKYPKKGFTEFCAYDDGISIPGNFQNHGIEFTNDSEAIKLAMNGTSTKYEDDGRGWGINSLIQNLQKV
jgi:hypothetical protein